MKPKLVLICLLIATPLLAQVRTTQSNIFFAKEWSKDIALYHAKEYLISNILGVSEDVTQFECDPLVAASSGELTSLYYKCNDQNKEGLIFGFWGTFWNNAGVIYQEYAYKNFTRDSATLFLNKLNKVIEENKSYLYINKNGVKNNVYFKFVDTLVLLDADEGGVRMRVFWNQFDANWDVSEFNKTKRRFEKRSN
jgi:hypothetical protein